jgi:phosphatidylinositol alpha-mannosyltransferase
MFLPAKGSYYTLPIGINLPFEVRTFLRHHNFDIVHTHGFAPPELAFWALHYSNSINVVTFHTVNLPESYAIAKTYRFLFNKYNKKIHCRIAVSKSTQEAVKPYLPGLYQIIPNGIDTDKFNPMVKPLSEFNRARPKILYAGRLEKRKGLPILLEAFPLIKQRIPEAMLIIVGHGPEEKYCRELAGHLNIEASTFFVGFVQNDDLPHYYASCDLYCVPTPVPEATSIVILEAMAIGKPVVASDFMGYRELLGNNMNGILFKSNDPVDLAEKTVQVLQSKDLRTKIVQNGLKMVIDFDWRNIAKKIEGIYQELLTKGKFPN